MIAVLSAVWDEIEKLSVGMHTLQEGSAGEMSYKIGRIYGNQVLLGSTGVGIRRARAGASYIIQKHKPGIIISAGLGGGLSHALKVGDLVVGENVISLRKSESMKLFCEFPAPDFAHRRGDILTENRFVNDPGLKSSLFKKSGALVVDMETWGVAEAALRSQTPVMSVRSVSDESRERLPDLGAIYNAAGKLAPGKALPYFLRRPSLISPYLRFRFGSYKRAVNSLNSFIDLFLRRSD